jgi:TolB protein
MRLLLIVLLSVFGLAGYDATLTVEKKVDQRVHVAVQDGSMPGVVAKKIDKIFLDDLQISGHFIPDTKYRAGPYTDNIIDPSLRSDDYLIKYKYEGGRSSRLQIRLFDASNSKMLMEASYSVSNKAKYPFLVHKAVSEINSWLKFESIGWINRYVVFARYTGRKKSEILLSDYTFSYTKVIVHGGLNLFPHWGDTKQSLLYYTTYISGRPTLFRLNMHTGKTDKITSSTGMLACSDVSQNGKKLLLTMAPDGQSDIYELDLDSRNLKRLTKFGGIDVNGVYADGEKSIVFVSNRLGYPNIFKKTFQNGEVDQIVFHGKNNNSVDAYGDTVVFSSREGRGVFNLYTAHTDGTPGRPLTSGGVNQFPRFSPDGNTILYIKRSYEGNAVGYLGLQTNQSMLFPLGEHKIQSIDW